MIGVVWFVLYTPRRQMHPSWTLQVPIKSVNILNIFFFVRNR